MSGGQTEAQTKVERKWEPAKNLMTYRYVETRRSDKTVKRIMLGYVLKDHGGKWRAYMKPFELIGDREDAVLAQAMVEAEVRVREGKKR